MKTFISYLDNTGKSISFLIVSLSFIVFGCETTEKIDDFPLRPSKLVANCYFNPDSTWKVQVSKSLSVLDNAPLKLIDNATVKIYEENKLIDQINEPDEDGLYRSIGQKPLHGKEYRLEVSSPAFEEVFSATGNVPLPVPIVNTRFFVVDSSGFSDPYYSYHQVSGYLKISFQDPVEEHNYYKLKMYYYDSVFNYNDGERNFLHLNQRTANISSNDPVLEKAHRYANHYLFDDRLFNGKKMTLDVDFNIYSTAGMVEKYYIELTSLTKEAFLYRRTINEYSLSRNDPFAEPVMIYSNIENGYGIFAGYSRCVDTLVP